MFKTSALALLGAAAIAAPGAATAQPFYGPAYGQTQYTQYYGQPRNDNAPRGDWYAGRSRFAGYPEFRGIEEHIRREIQSGVREDLIEPEDARDLMNQLRDIQNWEAREFRIHGWNLPGDDRYRLRSRLDQLDRLVDQIRDEA